MIEIGDLYIVQNHFNEKFDKQIVKVTSITGSVVNVTSFFKDVSNYRSHFNKSDLKSVSNNTISFERINSPAMRILYGISSIDSEEK